MPIMQAFTGASFNPPPECSSSISAQLTFFFSLSRVAAGRPTLEGFYLGSCLKYKGSASFSVLFFAVCPISPISLTQAFYLKSFELYPSSIRGAPPSIHSFFHIYFFLSSPLSRLC